MAASIKDVAELAGVSTATVSHVVNGTRNTKPETRQRVLAAIEKLGYSRNLAARNLAMGRSNLLGLIISDIRNPFFPEVTSSFQDQALIRNLETVVLNTNYDTQRTAQAVQRLLGLQVAGIAVLTSQVDKAVRENLAQRKVPAVYLDLGEPGPHVSNITIGYEAGIGQAIANLAANGHREIGYIGGPAHLHSAQRRRHAFLKAVAEHGLPNPTALDSDFTVRGGFYTCSKLLAIKPLTAIVAANDMMAIGALHCAYDRGIKIPGQLSVIGFDDISFSEYTQPALTSVAVPREEIGRLALQALWELIERPNGGGHTHVVETRLIERGSSGPATQK
jgi:LacI family transcriptional regulator